MVTPGVPPGAPWTDTPTAASDPAFTGLLTIAGMTASGIAVAGSTRTRSGSCTFCSSAPPVRPADKCLDGAPGSASITSPYPSSYQQSLSVRSWLCAVTRFAAHLGVRARLNYRVRWW
jgi:hypothetical protein